MIPARREPPSPGRLRIDSRFGVFEADRRDVVTFPDGLPGFERWRQYVVLSSPGFAPLQLLQAVGEDAPSFLGVDPRLAFPGYRCRLAPRDRRRLGAADEVGLLWLAIVSMTNAAATVNLRAPIVINPDRMVGFQVVPHDALYPLTHPLSL